jgi:hypothetical protein
LQSNHTQDPKRLQPPFSYCNSILDDRVETIPGYAIPAPDAIAVRTFLSGELSSVKLSSIYPYLWMCGRRHNIHPLHWQKMMSRTIFITEQPSLHLVWYQSTIYIKPLPRFLMDWSFWDREICPMAEHEDSEKEMLWREANGFVFTYTRLIVHESDFRIAHEIGLLPPEITWSQWSSLRFDMASALKPINRSTVTRRYEYGELRLARLNLVYRFFRFKLLGYHHVYRNYNSFFSQEFAWLLLLFAYVTVTLTAFQTATAFGDKSQILERVGNYFGMAVLFLVGVGSAIQIGLLVILFGFNLIWTLIQDQSGGTA